MEQHDGKDVRKKCIACNGRGRIAVLNETCRTCKGTGMETATKVVTATGALCMPPPTVEMGESPLSGDSEMDDIINSLYSDVSEAFGQLSVIGLSEFWVPNTVVHLAVDGLVSHCPLNDKANYGTLTIEYVPHDCIIETRSLASYVEQFREVREFNETLVCRIAHDIHVVLGGVPVRVTGTFAPRDGIHLECVVSLPVIAIGEDGSSQVIQ